MTHAICVHCGHFKFGCLVRCKHCGRFPETRRDFGYSYALSDHYFTREELEAFSRGMIEENRSHPVLPPEQEAEFIAQFAPRGLSD